MATPIMSWIEIFAGGSQDHHLLVPTLCRADLGWIFYFGPANCRKIAGEFLSEFWWRILMANFSALFFHGFRPPKKFTPKIHVQNCRHSFPISLSWTQNLFTAIFCLRGRPRSRDHHLPSQTPIKLEFPSPSFPWVFWCLLCLFQGFRGFGRDRKSLIRLTFSLMKTRKSKEGMTGFWEKESIHRPAPVQNFSLPKNMGATEERFWC